MRSRTRRVARVSRPGYSLLMLTGALGVLTQAGCGGDGPTPPAPSATPAVASTPSVKKAAPKGKVQILEEDTGHNLRRQKMKKG